MNCCWKSAQNATDAMNMGMNETTRLRSSGCVLGLVISSANSATAPTTAIAVTMSARDSSGMRPRASAVATSTTTTTATTRARTRCGRGSGSGTTAPTPLSVAPRTATYWMRPIAIPAAAAPNPQWNPLACHSTPVISGPVRPPMFTAM